MGMNEGYLDEARSYFTTIGGGMREGLEREREREKGKGVDHQKVEKNGEMTRGVKS